MPIYISTDGLCIIIPIEENIKHLLASMHLQYHCDICRIS